MESFYNARSRKTGEDPSLAVQFPSQLQKRMLAAGFSWRGPTQLYWIDDMPQSMGNFFELILERMMLEDVPRLYGADSDKMVLHMDSASSHIKSAVCAWLVHRGMEYLTEDERLVYSPEVSPMDFCANGYLNVSCTSGSTALLQECWSVLVMSGQMSLCKCYKMLSKVDQLVFQQFI